MTVHAVLDIRSTNIAFLIREAPKISAPLLRKKYTANLCWVSDNKPGRVIFREKAVWWFNMKLDMLSDSAGS